MSEPAAPRANPAPIGGIAITYPAELPVSQRRQDIADAIRGNQVVIVAGETGSGKTTQLPKILLELGYTRIAHTQPRRIAARSVAERIAEELGVELGTLVGYKVRFTDKVGRDTRIALMTDGVLLNEVHRDRDLARYDAIIIDEAHERSLNIDFLIGILHQLLPRRPELRVVVTSATIDPGSFARHFAAADGTPAPIVEVSGRTYPVEIRYRPLTPDGAEAVPDEFADEVEGLEGVRPPASQRDSPTPATPTSAPIELFDGIAAALDELEREAPGDVLVFLSGEAEIRDTADGLRARYAKASPGHATEVLPLYGRLSAEEQHRVFRPSTTPGLSRRIVLATNVAETSLTVPGIRYVIDAGTARISRYSVRSKVQRLPIEAISQASANQRSGRSGRTSPGIAIRLYSEADYLSRPEFTEPEILRTNLAAVILQMIALGLGDVAEFPFLQPPDSRGIKDGLELLTELGAIEAPRSSRRSPKELNETAERAQPRITRTGRGISQLPIDPRFARMVIESGRHNTTREVMAIVAGLSIQDPRERPVEKRQQADDKHARFLDPASDFLTLLNLWNYLEERQGELSGNQFRRLCRAEFLNYLRVREWQDVYRQLRRMTGTLGLTVGEPTINPSGIHRSILAGLLSQIGLISVSSAPPSKGAKAGSAQQLRGREYVGARQTRFSLFPGSALARKPPAAVMSAELVETSRLYARMNAAIDPAWAEEIAGELVKRSYSEPHWEKQQGAVVAWEKVTLYGVPIIARRRMQYARIDPELARELFIRHALVEGDWQSPEPFDRANRALREQLAQVEERTRRRDILQDDEAVFAFYDARIPDDVCSTRTFEGWWRRTRLETPELLTLTLADLVEEPESALDEAAYPAFWQQGDQRIALAYRFEPGTDDDGVTALVPLALLPRLTSAGFDWQVPGFREELIIALIKTLPKPIRKNVVPAADWARRLGVLLPAEAPTGVDAPALTATLATLIRRETHVPVGAGDFDRLRLPPHLRVTFTAIDASGRRVAWSKDLAALQSTLKERARDDVARATGPTGPAAAGSPAGAAGSTTAAARATGIERTGLTRWDFDELPRVIDTPHGEGTIRAYPALVDEADSVAIRLLTSAADQAAAMPLGVRRLLLAAVPSPVAYVRQHLTQAEKLNLAISPYRSVDALLADVLAACVDDVLFRAVPDGQVFLRAVFETTRDRVSAVVMEQMFQTTSLIARILGTSREIERAVKAASSMALIAALADIRAQLDALIHPGFVVAAGLARLQHYPRYLAAILERVHKLTDNPNRDRVWLNEVQEATRRYAEAGGTLPPGPGAPANLVHARWLLEELRVSLFAQPLGTAETVSLQRISKLLAG